MPDHVVRSMVHLANTSLLMSQIIFQMLDSVEHNRSIYWYNVKLLAEAISSFFKPEGLW